MCDGSRAAGELSPSDATTQHLLWEADVLYLSSSPFKGF